MMDETTAAVIAITAHDGQYRKGTIKQPFVCHPMRVAAAAQDAGMHQEFIAVAWLHDVIEDTDVTMKSLFDKGLSSAQLHTLEALTQRKGTETYYEYITRVCKAGRRARLIKKFDILDNLVTLPEEMSGMKRRYHRALGMISMADESDVTL